MPPQLARISVYDISSHLPYLASQLQGRSEQGKKGGVHIVTR